MVAKLRIISVLVIVLFLTACSNETGKPVLELDREDAGTSIEIKAGETFTIKIDGNPGTGYGWYYQPAEKALLELVSEPEFTQESGENVMGAGGMYTFLFKAVTEGTTTLRLAYMRIWETEVPPAEVYEINVTIK